MFTSIDTAIEEMIQSNIDGQDLVCRLDAEQYTDQCISDCEDSISELIVRLEALEDKAREDKALDVLEEALAEEQEPRAVNQIDWIMTHHGLIAGYDSKSMLESYVRSVLPADQTHQAEMIIAMTLATARNIINKKLEAE
tara:strand:+ start:151 stop:570 length:420 start_codon:yes stop_codon:yes gene_type:complete